MLWLLLIKGLYFPWKRPGLLDYIRTADDLDNLVIEVQIDIKVCNVHSAFHQVSVGINFTGIIDQYHVN